MSEPVTYKDSGVDIDAANAATARIKKLARSTFNENVMSEIGGFGGMFNGLFSDIREPVLVASCDGVGTKVKIARATGGHEAIGYDLVTASVNDVLAQGAKPIFFMDYIATGKLEPEVVVQLVEGMARACRESNCALLGGETAEMPGMYHDGEYDLAGFVVGVVDKRKIINGSRITGGDLVIGLESTGLHTNGYSLARKLLFETAGHTVDTHLDELGCTVGAELGKPHKNYLPAIERLIEHEGVIKGIAHITGGGLVENLPRILPRNVDAQIKQDSWPVPPVFTLLQRLGNIPSEEMRRTFNLGIGLVLVVNPKFQQFVADQLNYGRERFHIIGEIVDGTRQVTFV